MVSVADAYALLGVEPTCTESELSKAYRKLALKHHPDKNGNDPAAAERMQAISEAKDVVDASRTPGVVEKHTFAVLVAPFVLFYLLWTVLWAVLWTDTVDFTVTAWTMPFFYALVVSGPLGALTGIGAFVSLALGASFVIFGTLFVDFFVIFYEHAFKTTTIALVLTRTVSLTSSTPVIFWLGTHWLGYAHWIRPYAWHPYMLTVVLFHTTRSMLLIAYSARDDAPIMTLMRAALRIGMTTGLAMSTFPLMAHEFAADAYSWTSPYFYVWIAFTLFLIFGILPHSVAEVAEEEKENEDE